MEEIFHEKQEGQLCAQHCLNSLLQGPIYTAVDLASIAQELDDEERRMGGEEPSRSVRASGNMDDSGFFSVQVIANALKVWGLDIVSYSSTDVVAAAARENPTTQKAFICNYQQHWFTIRKLGNQWFNLNSLLTGPQLVSDTFLGLFLAQLETEGYTIYLVHGELPDCQADQLLRLMPAVQTVPPGLIGGASRGRAGRAAATATASAPKASSGGDEEAELQAALAMSLGQRTSRAGSEEEELKLAMQLSKSMMDQDEVTMRSTMTTAPNAMSEEDQLQEAIAMSLQRSGGFGKESNEDELQAAIASSMEGSASKPSTSSSQSKPHKEEKRPAGPPASSATSAQAVPRNDLPENRLGEGTNLGGGSRTSNNRQSTPDPDEVRRRRLAFLDKMNADK